MTTETVDQASARLGLTAPRVTPNDIETNIASEWYFTAAEGVAGAASIKHGILVVSEDVPPPPALSLLTVCVLVTLNGFTEVGTSAPASPENFNAELGKRYAREDAIKKLWPKMGYLLREDLFRAQHGIGNPYAVQAAPPPPFAVPLGTIGDGPTGQDWDDIARQRGSDDGMPERTA